jgi:hypothetical protein
VPAKGLNVAPRPSARHPAFAVAFALVAAHLSFQVGILLSP